MSVVESSKDIELYLRQDSHTISYRKCTEDHCHVVELGSGRLTFTVIEFFILLKRHRSYSPFSEGV